MDETKPAGQTVPLEPVVMPLRCQARGNGWLDIAIGIAELRFAAEQHPDFWDGKRHWPEPNIKITDATAFAAEVARVINRESEDGSTLLTQMLDKAIRLAVEDGCEGVDHEAA